MRGALDGWLISDGITAWFTLNPNLFLVFSSFASFARRALEPLQLPALPGAWKHPLQLIIKEDNLLLFCLRSPSSILPSHRLSCSIINPETDKSWLQSKFSYTAQLPMSKRSGNYGNREINCAISCYLEMPGVILFSPLDTELITSLLFSSIDVVHAVFFEIHCLANFDCFNSLFPLVLVGPQHAGKLL